MVASIPIMRRSFSFLILSVAVCLVFFVLFPAGTVHAQFVEYKLTAADSDPNDRFGEAVAIDGSTAVIGAFRDDDAGFDAGAAYIFQFNDNNWTQTAKIIPNEGNIILPGFLDNGLFGGALDIRNSVIVVGAVDTRENGIKTGAAYIYEATNEGEWKQLARLIPNDGGANDKFGATVATNGDFALVGALDHDHSNLGNAGAVYVYVRNGNEGDPNAEWEFSEKLTPSDAQAGDSFGWSVDVAEDRAVIGARDDDDRAENAGAVYIYELQGDSWQEIDKIYAEDANPDDSFGEVVATDGNQIIVGARDVDTNGDESGAAYIFENQSGEWVQTAKLLASDGVSLDRFGNSVTIDGDIAVVSTRIDNDFAGAIYVFQKIGDTWTEVSKVTPAGLEAGDLFGQAVNMDGTLIISGTKGDDEEGLDAGAAHVFDLAGTDRGILVALYNATNGPNWSRKTNWLSDAPLENWFGVTTNDDGQVTELALDQNTLNGALPSAIGGLSALKKLTLRGNDLSGTIPTEIGELAALETLNLGENELVSPLPEGLASLNQLKTLFLDNNEFTGTIPDAIHQIPNLETLYLSNNQFSGAVPEKLAGVSTLRVLHLESNMLTDLPDFFQNGMGPPLSNLVVFDNLLTFEDLEPNVNVGGFEYSPQANVGEARTLSVTEDTPLLLQTQVGGTQNIYQWVKDGSVIQGANTDTYIVPSAGTGDAGEYILRVTNSLVPNITITSEPITVEVIPVVNFASNLSSIHVVPPLLTSATGNIDATLVGNQLSISGSFEQLTADFSGAYIHAGAPGVNTEQAFELSVNISGNEGVLDSNANQFDLTNEQLIALQNGLFYISIETESGNIADPQTPELRGQIYVTPNGRPEQTTISSPANGASIDLGTAGDIQIDWNAVSDPDGHTVNYLWAFSRDRNFEENITLIEGVFYTGNATDFSISHENLDAFLAAQGVGQGEAITVFHLVASTDGSLFNASEVRSINLTRSTTNQAPRVNNPIADFVYLLEDGPASISLPDVFLDPDGDALSFTTSSSNENTATAVIDSESLIITPLALGTSTITVTAEDSFDETVSDMFELTINSRPVVATPISDQVLIVTDDPISVPLVDIFNDADPLTYSAGSGDPGVASAEIISNSTLQISPLDVGITTITLTAEDDKGASQDLTFSVTVQSDVIMPPQSVSENISITFGNPDLSSSYRLVALPGQVNLALASAIPGTPEEDWIAFRDNGQDVDDREAYFVRYDGSSSFTFRPGSGFWLLSRQPWERVENRPTVALAQDQTFSIPLQAGWNIISNPFDIDVPWQAVSQLNETSQLLYAWQNRYVSSPVFRSASSGSAFYFFNSEELSELKLPYIPAVGSTKAEKKPALDIHAVAAGDTLSTIRVGRHPDALPGFDKLDQVAPPGIFEQASLKIARADVSANSRQAFLAAEFQPQDAVGFRYTFTLDAPTGEPTVLHFEGFENFEDYQEFSLFDGKLAKRYDLRKNPSLTFWPKSKKTEFVLLIGDEAFIEAEQATLTPEAITLQPNYPNPFTKETTIEFTVTEPSQLRVVVYDALGRQVRLLADGVYDAGHHQIRWNGEGDAGAPLGSGLYFYQLQLQETQIVRSMILRR